MGNLSSILPSRGRLGDRDSPGIGLGLLAPRGERAPVDGSGMPCRRFRMSGAELAESMGRLLDLGDAFRTSRPGPTPSTMASTSRRETRWSVGCTARIAA